MAKASISKAKKARFEAVNLSFNLGRFAPGELMDCNPGGSVICPAGTGCPPGTCVGTSCSGQSATVDLGFDARILVARTQLAKFRSEIQAVVAKFSKTGGR